MLQKFFSRLVIISLLTLFCVQVGKAAVDLVDFSATPLSESILIEWETATEIDNAGFFVTRNTPGEPFEAVSGFIPAEGSGVIGAEYQFEDEDVLVGVRYYYVLEAIDTSQNVEYHGPITAMIIDQGETPTAAPTNTYTPTPNPSKTSTYTPIPTLTYTPAPPTLTPTPYTETPTITSSPTITPTATLENPPALILTLPATNTPLPTDVQRTVFSPVITPVPAGLFAQLVDSGYPLTMGAICLVSLVWAALAVGVFILIQYRNS